MLLGRGEEQGGFHAAFVGEALARDVEGGAVVGAGAEEREADGEVDGAVPGEGLQWCQALVVVHGDDEVKAGRGVEDAL